MLIPAHGNRPVVIGSQRFLIDISHSIGIDFTQLHFDRRVHRVIGDEPSSGTRGDTPEFGFGQITAQPRAVFDHPRQRIFGRKPATDRQLRQ
ncbi:hypothetical protein D3C87_1994090 [compost metagenome]